MSCPGTLQNITITQDTPEEKVMGWKDWRSEDAQTVEEIVETVRQMHDEQDAGPLPGTEDAK